MAPLDEGDTVILGKLADIAQHQAVVMERLLGVLERLESHMKRSDRERDAAIAGVKSHVTEVVRGEMNASDVWWRRASLVGIGLIMLAIVAGAALERFLPLLKR